MTIDCVVAQALELDLDVVEALPELQTLPIEEVESRIDDFLDRLQDGLVDAIESRGMCYLVTGDAAGLCEMLLGEALAIPLPMLLRLCRSIVSIWKGELGTSAYTCLPVYFVRLVL